MPPRPVNGEELISYAQVLKSAAAAHAKATREVGDELLRLVQRISATPSEVIGGLIAGGSSIAIGVIALTSTVGLMSSAALALPFWGVAGAAMGILIWRNIGRARDRREAKDNIQYLEDWIRRAEDSGAPPDIVDGMRRDLWTLVWAATTNTTRTDNRRALPPARRAALPAATAPGPRLPVTEESGRGSRARANVRGDVRPEE